MYIFAKFKWGALFLSVCMLVCALATPAFATKVEQTEAQEVLFTAERPIDFNQVIVVTATSIDTGYIYSYYLRPESNYETYPLMPYGEYSIAASVSPVVDGTDDGTVYIVRPETDTFFVKKSTYTPALSFIVEGYTNTEQEDDVSNGNGSSEENQDPSGATGDGSENSSNNSADDSDHPNDSSSENQSPEDNSENSGDGKKSSLLGSLIFSALAILIFFIGGYFYRRYKEG